MTRKDEKDTERPHYYSQFWLDVAAGRRVIGTPKTDADESADSSEADLPEPISILRKGGRVTPSVLVDGHFNSHARGFDTDEDADEEEDLDEELDLELDLADEPDLITPEVEEEALAGEMGDTDIPDFVLDVPVVEEKVVPEPLAAIDEGESEEEFFDDEEEEEEEEEDGWAARGRKKPKPGRQVKTPKPPVKKPKRGGRGF